MRLALSLAAILSVSSLAPVQAEGLTAMNDAERVAFDAAVRDYLLRNPEVIVEAMTELQLREERDAASRDIEMLAANKDRIFNSPGDWAGGNLEGDITLVEFMDYRCGYCHKAFQEVEELVKSDGNIRFVLKEFPVLGEQSVLAAKFAIAIRQLYGDDAYKAAHDALFALRGDMTTETLSRVATDLGHDANVVLAKTGDPAVQAVIDENYALAGVMELNGTPSFVLGDVMLRGYLPLDVMRQMVADARKG
ncbi:DsbA family protein [Pseudogemmobacter faecipullorum]|uniref:DsbA family protein n=1 Tax=Pseudogemmobacter faecipullorum TaxID=2755041 RepID=A0ABS8CJ07_9RHOB|nr:DsbA family protein [Pseudogemmobacter faecipullorum]MCB5409366.1 DsbA family protein [Pseudogemmobacter faecipullorum]